MTREEAIEVFAELNYAYKADEYGDYFYDHGDEVCQAAIVAIAALREQKEKEPCEACHFFADAREQDFGLYETIMFEFCPVCGRRLEEA